ncbi:uncharacterized protein PHALS_08104 [Plasmopara halstedii]|uniref:Uncharacterized protein n=1 Tax=Plasmopara halstedii TaxID=4781 RepID=A0A0P1B7Q1_PLAHL|nr:uncharacterized protein PHALS_08104 [Plasmopara halstedii]CEG50393.1 hypothetical protein PHALS_08104 [Plasmopara halstedii]|eukprot:XP_024586762.1 hypothetical protein PHALS_08104 [Plasmopara halstedii]
MNEESDTSTDPPDSNSDGGEAVENEMKRLRVTYNYDGAHGVRWAGEATSVDTSVETLRARIVRGNYAEANAMLREFHYLRQLRKFQAERGRARANYLEHQVDEPDFIMDGLNKLKRKC